MSSDLLAKVELAAVRGWPALDHTVIEGWRARFTSGGSIRANSVATLRFEGRDAGAAIDAVERFYARHDARAVFTITQVSQPANVDERLAARGYMRGDDHVTMVKPVTALTQMPPLVTTHAAATQDWMAVYLTGLLENRRAVAPTLIAALTARPDVGIKPVLVTAYANGRAISSGLTVVDGDVASVQCMATLPDARRRGGAWTVLAAIEVIAAQGGATHLYLQSAADNTAARTLYARFGFTVLGRHWTRTAPQLVDTPR